MAWIARYKILGYSMRDFSHKMNIAGLNYEVYVLLRSKTIVCVNGPLPCGAWPDLKIFKEKPKYRIYPGETLVADLGYRDPLFITPNGFQSAVGKIYSKLRVRHESLNGHLKSFRVLRLPFRHELSRHTNCFNAVANVAQLSLQHQTLFSIPTFDECNR